MKNRFLSVLSVIFVSWLTQPFLQNPGLAHNYTDTIRIECLKFAAAQTTVTADVTIWNDQLIQGFSIPLTFYIPGNTDIVCDSVGWSSFFWSNKPPFYGDTIDSTEKKLILYGAYTSKPNALPIGDHLLATLFFTTGPTWDSSIPIIIDSTSWYFNGALGIELVDTQYYPQVIPHAFIPGCRNLPQVPSHTSGALIILIGAVAGFFIFAIMMRRKISTIK